MNVNRETIERELRRRSMPKRYKRRSTMRPTNQSLLRASRAELEAMLHNFSEAQATKLEAKPKISERKRKRANAIFAEVKAKSGLKAAFQARKQYLA